MIKNAFNPECRFLEVWIYLRFLTPELSKDSETQPLPSSVLEILQEIAGRFWVETLHCIKVQVIEQKNRQLKVKVLFAEIKDRDGYWTSRTGDSTLKQVIGEALRSDWNLWGTTDQGGLPQLDQILVYQIERNPVASKLFDQYRSWLALVGNPKRVSKGGRLPKKQDSTPDFTR